MLINWPEKRSGAEHHIVHREMGAFCNEAQAVERLFPLNCAGNWNAAFATAQFLPRLKLPVRQF